MSSHRIVIIGADAAGMSAAHQALRTAADHGRELEVVAVEASGHTSYSACGIPYWIAGDVGSAEALVARTAEQHRAAGIDLRLHTEATGLDTEARVVTVRSADGEQRLGYDEVVIATGAAAVVPDWALGPDGTAYPGVGTVKDLDDGAAWLDRLVEARERRSGRTPRVVVAGGGYIGLEMAEAALRRDCEVSLLTRSRVMSSLDEEMGSRVTAALAGAGVRVREGATVAGLEVGDDGWVCGVARADGSRVDADLVVLALGVRPRTGFAVAAGLPTGEYDGLLTDDTGRVAPGVWGAGDCCEAPHRLLAARRFLPLGTHASKQGRVVGTNLGGGDVRFAGVLGTAITRFVHGDHHLEVALTGLTEAAALAAGRQARSLVTEGTTASGYMPEAEPIAVKVVAEEGTRRLLGVQVVGGPGSGKRIDTAAMALWAELTVDEVSQVDLSYAPPFSTTWEIVQIAVRRLAERMG